MSDQDEAAPGPLDVESLQREHARLARRVRRLEETLVQMEEIRDANAHVLDRLVADLEAERLRSHELLLNVLPEAIVNRLDRGETLIADRHDHVAVLFSDFVGFTQISSGVAPAELVGRLNELFSGFDAASERHRVEKIKTIGDAYLAVAGLTDDHVDPVAATADLALDMLDVMRDAPPPWAVRIGIHTGPAVAGVIGTRKFAYDVWGDTVNVASRLESTGQPGRIHVSAEVAAALDGRYLLEPRGDTELKGKGSVPTYFLLRRATDRRPSTLSG